MLVTPKGGVQYLRMSGHTACNTNLKKRNIDFGIYVVRILLSSHILRPIQKTDVRYKSINFFKSYVVCK